MSQTRLKKKYLKRAHHLLERAKNSQKLQASVEPYICHTPDNFRRYRRVKGQEHDRSHGFESHSSHSTSRYTPHPAYYANPGSMPGLVGTDHMVEKQCAGTLTETHARSGSDSQTRFCDHPSPVTPRSLYQSPEIGGSYFPVTPTRGSSVIQRTGAVNPGAYALSSTPVGNNGTSAASRADERESHLMARLQVQMDINRELKRLLVAAVGGDLQHRLDQVAREKAVLSQDLDASVQQLTENGEDFDRVSIECDIWRSKFLASRVMIDELASWKAELSVQFRDSQRALRGLLKEREELCVNTVECNVHLGRAVDCLRHSEVVKSSSAGASDNPGVLSGRKIGTVSPVQLGGPPSKAVQRGETVASSSPNGTTVVDIAHLNLSMAKRCSQLASVSVMKTAGTGRWNGASASSLVTEQTAAEELACQVLKVRGNGLGSPDRSLLLPKLRLNEEELARQRLQGRRLPSPANQIPFYVDDPFHVPFHCTKCRGNVMVV